MVSTFLGPKSNVHHTWTIENMFLWEQGIGQEKCDGLKKLITMLCSHKELLQMTLVGIDTIWGDAMEFLLVSCQEFSTFIIMMPGYAYGCVEPWEKNILNYIKYGLCF